MEREEEKKRGEVNVKSGEAGRGAGDTIRHPTTPNQKHQRPDLFQAPANAAAQP